MDMLWLSSFIRHVVTVVLLFVWHWDILRIAIIRELRLQLALVALRIYLPVAAADPGGVQDVQTPALLTKVPFLNRTYFQNMSLAEHFSYVDNSNINGRAAYLLS